MMSPVDDAALGVPFVLAPKGHKISPLQVIEASRKINVVADEQRVPGLEAQDKSLVPCPLGVVGKLALDHALCLDPRVGGAVRERAKNKRFAFDAVRLAGGRLSQALECGFGVNPYVRSSREHEQERYGRQRSAPCPPGADVPPEPPTQLFLHPYHY